MAHNLECLRHGNGPMKQLVTTLDRLKSIMELSGRATFLVARSPYNNPGPQTCSSPTACAFKRRSRPLLYANAQPRPTEGDDDHMFVVL